MARRSKEWYEGYDMQQRTFKKKPNPYPPESDQAKEWDAGSAQAYEDEQGW